MSWSGPQLVETTHQEWALQEGEKVHKAFVLSCQGQEDGDEASHLCYLVMAPFSICLPTNESDS